MLINKSELRPDGTAICPICGNLGCCLTLRLPDLSNPEETYEARSVVECSIHGDIELIPADVFQNHTFWPQ